MSTIVARTSAKHLREWADVINTIPQSAVSYGKATLSGADIVLVENGGLPKGSKDKYLIGVDQQRVLNKVAANKLLDSFHSVHPWHTSEIIRVRPVENPLNYYVPDGQTRLLALTLDPNQMSKEFRVVTYDKVTAEQMVALFEFHAFRRNTSAQDKLALYRYMSPVFKLTQAAPSKYLKPLLTRPRGASLDVLRLTWTKILAGWMLGNTGNTVPSAIQRKKSGRPITSSGYNSSKVVALFKSDDGIKAFQDVERMVAAVQRATEMTHEAMASGHKVRLSDLGKTLARQMQRFDQERDDASWMDTMLRPSRRVHHTFWSMPMIRILITLVRFNGEQQVYLRLPTMMRNVGRFELGAAPTNHSAPYLRDDIEKAINYNASKKLRFDP